MDTRDKSLHRHMKRRKEMATNLPISIQAGWAKKCIAKAGLQQRNLFYIMASMWLSDIELKMSGIA